VLEPQEPSINAVPSKIAIFVRIGLPYLLNDRTGIASSLDSDRIMGDAWPNLF